MMDLCRKLEALAHQLDREGTVDQVKPYLPLRRADAPTLRQASHVIQKLTAQIAMLRARLESEIQTRRTG